MAKNLEFWFFFSALKKGWEYATQGTMFIHTCKILWYVYKQSFMVT